MKEKITQKNYNTINKDKNETPEDNYGIYR